MPDLVARYLRISDQQLLSAIDQMTFDHGETRFSCQTAKKKIPTKGCNPSREICVQGAYKLAYDKKSKGQGNDLTN